MDIKRLNYNDKCWWCGNIADSREHKLKKTDIERIYGTGSYQDKKLILRKNTSNLPLRGSKSDYMKFEKCMCKNCNNARSHSIDVDYTFFTDYIFKNTSNIFNEGYIDLTEVFGNQWEEKTKNIFRYLAKHVACQAATANYEVSNNIIDFLNKETDSLIDINFMFQFRELNLYLSQVFEDDAYKQLFLGDFQYTKTSSDSLGVNNLYGFYTLDWFSVNYLYQKNIVSKVYDNKSPFDNHKILIEIVGRQKYPSFKDITNIEEMMNILEYFDRGKLSKLSQKLHEDKVAFNFLNKLQTFKSFF